MNELILAASFALNVLGMATTAALIRKVSLLEGELRGLREGLRLTTPRSPEV